MQSKAPEWSEGHCNFIGDSWPRINFLVGFVVDLGILGITLVGIFKRRNINRRMALWKTLVQQVSKEEPRYIAPPEIA